MTRKRLSLLVLFLLLSGVLLVTNLPSQGMSKSFTVKLYAESGQVVGTWKARDIGRVEGSSVVFTAGSDLNPRTVRISGTYSIEQTE